MVHPFIIRSPFLFQLVRFGIVGSIAAAVHFSTVVCLVELKLMPPLTANIIAFLMGFQVSYWGHRRWTFKGTTVYHHVAMMRLFIVAATNLVANQTLFYFFFKVIQLPYMLALLLVLSILPVMTFILGKFWVFK
jgi:putative flippase GtrA